MSSLLFTSEDDSEDYQNPTKNQQLLPTPESKASSSSQYKGIRI
jgi:hypothetical protein